MRRYLAFLLFLLLPFASLIDPSASATAQAPNYGLSLGIGDTITFSGGASPTTYMVLIKDETGVQLKSVSKTV